MSTYYAGPRKMLRVAAALRKVDAKFDSRSGACVICEAATILERLAKRGTDDRKAMQIIHAAAKVLKKGAK